MIGELAPLDWRALAAVAAGGGAGSLIRYVLTLAALQRFGPNFPWGTLIVNVSGSLLIGMVFQLSQTRSGASPSLVRLFLMPGLLGGYTTFSAFALDALVIALNRAPATASAYAVGSVVLSVGAAFSGMAIVRAVQHL